MFFHFSHYNCFSLVLLILCFHFSYYEYIFIITLLSCPFNCLLNYCYMFLLYSICFVIFIFPFVLFVLLHPCQWYAFCSQLLFFLKSVLLDTVDLISVFPPLFSSNIFFCLYLSLFTVFFKFLLSFSPFESFSCIFFFFFFFLLSSSVLSQLLYSSTFFSFLLFFQCIFSSILLSIFFLLSINFDNLCSFFPSLILQIKLLVSFVTF